MTLRFVRALLLFVTLATPALAEDGYDLWLRYRPVEKHWRAHYRTAAQSIVPAGSSETIAAAREELAHGLGRMLRESISVEATVNCDGAILLGTPSTSATIASLNLPLKDMGTEGYLIRSAQLNHHKVIVIAANADIGVLYGAFAFLRMMQTRALPDSIDVASKPRIQHRMLDHWDNLDGTMERGYAGLSIWDWHDLPHLSPRYTDYARANASIGINRAVLNNVGAQAAILTPPYLEKAAALAGVFRPYGIRVYFSARFSAPIEIGGLKTADPLDPSVKAWWRDEADEIYRHIPDFGGFLVKANSEGQPGPQDYGRNHADGANMLARALAPHKGIVMWRAFVYNPPAHPNQVSDRAAQAYDQFKPLDGKFDRNVLVQVKNGAIDFQPREPAHPLFGAMPDTSLTLEFQVTKEYLGYATHLVYLGALFQETLRFDTRAGGKPMTVARVLEGAQDGHVGGIAGVANIGSSRNWTGSTFDQANWYAVGRLAWNPDLDSRAIAREWAGQTFAPDARIVDPVVAMMMRSREAAVDYMTPLGLHHMMGTGHHYGPAPWVDDLGRADWNPVYYHRAGRDGIGFERTASGSNAVAQYAPDVARRFAAPATTPPELLLWFHHLPWDYRMPSGRTLWEDLVAHYDRGVAEVDAMQAEWQRLRPFIDARRHDDVAQRLAQQRREAQWWRDACIAYFQHASGLPLPKGVPAPAQSLDYYRSLAFPYAPGHG